MIKPDQLEQLVAAHCTQKEQEAIQLVWIEGYGFRKTARKLDIDIRTVRDRLDRARNRLRRHGITADTVAPLTPGTDPAWRELALWMHQREARQAATEDEPAEPTDNRKAGDPFLLRGIPVVGVPGGIGGTLPADKPGSDRALQRAVEQIATRRTRQ